MNNGQLNDYRELGALMQAFPEIGEFLAAVTKFKHFQIMNDNPFFNLTLDGVFISRMVTPNLPLDSCNHN